MSIDALFQEHIAAIRELTAAINHQTASMSAGNQPTVAATAKPKATKPAPAETPAPAVTPTETPAPATAYVPPPAPAPAAPAPAAPAPAAPAPAPAPTPAESPDVVTMQMLSKKALDLVKADGGSKARLLEIMKAVDPAATSIPTVKPEHYKGLYDGIDAALAGV